VSQSRWENAAVELLTEVSILGALISTRIDETEPVGLNECRLSILMILSRNEVIGMKRAALEWTLEDSEPSVAIEIDTVIELGLVSVSGDDLLQITALGRDTLDGAIRALMPQFEPALQDVPIEAMTQAMEVVREIRRTLDNLPAE
jgi:hypothetical protein